MAKVATEIVARGNQTQAHEMVHPVPIQPRPELNRLDQALRYVASLLILIGSCFIINPLGHDESSVQHEAFLVLALVIFGVSLLFISVMVARSPSAAALASFVVKLIHNCVFGEA